MLRSISDTSYRKIAMSVPEVWKHVDVYGGGGITEDITEDDADKE